MRPGTRAPRLPLCAGRQSLNARPRETRLAVDQGAVYRQTADRFGDLRQPVGEVGAVAGEYPVAVVFDLVQPGGADGRPVDEERLTGEDETGRRGAPGGPESRYATTCGCM